MTFTCCARDWVRPTYRLANFSRIQVDWIRTVKDIFWPNLRNEKLRSGRLVLWGSATRAWNVCGVHSIKKVENLCPIASKASLICRTEPRLNFIRDIPTLAMVKYLRSRARRLVGKAMEERWT